MEKKRDQWIIDNINSIKTHLVLLIEKEIQNGEKYPIKIGPLKFFVLGFSVQQNKVLKKFISNDLSYLKPKFKTKQGKEVLFFSINARAYSKLLFSVDFDKGFASIVEDKKQNLVCLRELYKRWLSLLNTFWSGALQIETEWIVLEYIYLSLLIEQMLGTTEFCHLRELYKKPLDTLRENDLGYYEIWNESVSDEASNLLQILDKEWVQAGSPQCRFPMIVDYLNNFDKGFALYKAFKKHNENKRQEKIQKNYPIKTLNKKNNVVLDRKIKVISSQGKEIYRFRDLHPWEVFRAFYDKANKTLSINDEGFKEIPDILGIINNLNKRFRQKEVPIEFKKLSASTFQLVINK